MSETKAIVSLLLCAGACKESSGESTTAISCHAHNGGESAIEISCRQAATRNTLSHNDEQEEA
jgi:hypothetical protein